MREKLSQWLVCPECQSSLELHPFLTENGKIIEGMLLCRGCLAEYLIVDAVPHMLPPAIYDNPPFREKYKAQLAKITPGCPAAPQKNDDLADHKRRTDKTFGKEWEIFDRFGWDDADWSPALEADRFRQNTFFDRDDLDGKLVLDAGCGNGRYMKQALDLGATVIGVDLSEAICIARKNLGANPNAFFVRGDLLKLPFRADTFDAAFSIGVLMHTGDTHKAFDSIVHAVRPGGLAAISVYQKQNPLHEFNDWWLRLISTRLPQLVRYYTSLWLSRFARLAWKVRLLGLINAFCRLEPYHHCVYDWYSAPVALHHTLPEVRDWYKQIHAYDIRDPETEKIDTRGPIARWIWPRCGFTVRAAVKVPKHPQLPAAPRHVPAPPVCVME
jgi:SAM-dependent methyltransferase/uncharacterized protein YbaR (Trm112 family)